MSPAIRTATLRDGAADMSLANRTATIPTELLT